MGILEALARAHEDDLCQSLDKTDRGQLAVLLGRIAQPPGLTPWVHPGYHYLNEIAEPGTTRAEMTAT